jgi:hypothetical protein
MFGQRFSLRQRSQLSVAADRLRPQSDSIENPSNACQSHFAGAPIAPEI